MVRFVLTGFVFHDIVYTFYVMLVVDLVLP